MMNYNNDENISSPILPMSRLPQDIRIKGNNQISKNARRRLRREYGIDFRGKTKAQQKQLVKQTAMNLRGGTRNFRNETFAYRFLARNYNTALVPIRQNIINQRIIDNQEIILNFTLRFEGWNSNIGGTPSKVIDRNYTKEIKRKDINSTINEEKQFMKEVFEDSPFKRSKVSLIKKDEINVNDAVPLEWTSLKMNGVMNLDNTALNTEWCKNRDMCVVDLIQFIYAKRKGFIKKNKDEDTIEYWATHSFQVHVGNIHHDLSNFAYKIQLKKLMNPNKTGYTLNHIKCWCENNHVNMYCMVDGKLIDFYYSERARIKKNPPLVFVIKNNHMYPILDTRKIKQITNNRKMMDLKELVKSNSEQEAKRKEDKTHDINIKFLCKETFYSTHHNTQLEYACEKMSQDNLMIYPAQNLTFYNGGLSSFTLGENKHLLYQDVIDDEKCNCKTQLMKNKNLRCIKKYCKDNDINFTGQSAPFFIKKYMDEFQKINSSYFGKDVEQVLSERGIKNRVHYGTTKQSSYDQLEYYAEHSICLDINKCYRSVMEDPSEWFMTIPFNEEIQSFTDDDGYSLPPPEGKYRLGLYFVETKDQTLFHYDNWYSSAMLNYAKDEDIEFKVKWFISGLMVDKNALLNIINQIKEDYPDPGLQKLMINCIWGFLMKTSNSSTNMNVDTDVNRVWDTYVKLQGKKNATLLMETIETTNGTKMYCYGEKKHTKLVNNNLPMGIQITDQANIKLHKMIKKMKGEKGVLLYRNTDCAWVGFENPADIPDVPVDKKVGGYNKAIKPLLTNIYLEKEWEERHVLCNYQPVEWNDLKLNDSDYAIKIIDGFITNGGGLLLGRAGTGKSWVCKKGKEYLKTKDLVSKCLAFTNKATIQLNGQTIHNFMRIDNKGKLNTKWAKQQAKKIDVIFIDEISMISSDLWKILAEFKYYTGITFILIGDYRQLPPVDDKLLGSGDWFNHSTIKWLANYNRCELTECKRYDPALWNLLEDIWENNGKGKATTAFLNKRTCRTIEELATSKNICYKNKTRKALNNDIQAYLLPQENRFIPYEGIVNKYNQDAYLFKGARFIMYLTTKCKTFKKNEEVEVVDYTDKIITIKSDDKTMDIKYDNKLFHKTFVLGYATTIHKSQGDTIEGKVNVFDVKFIMEWLDDKRALYTGLSRAKSLSNIRVSK